MEQTIYTVNVWMKDIKGAEHEKNYQFTTREVADEFTFKVQAVLTKLRKNKVIRQGVIKVTPPLPR